MRFDIIGELYDIETIARNRSIKDLRRLKRRYGNGRWRKRKGFGTIRYFNGIIVEAEIHRYKAEGIGKREYKVKRIIE